METMYNVSRYIRLLTAFIHAGLPGKRIYKSHQKNKKKRRKAKKKEPTTHMG